MKHRYFTFLYLPPGNAAPRELRVRRLLVYGLAAVVTVSLGAASWALLKYSSRIQDAYRLTQLERHNEQLQTELTSLDSELDRLRRQVAQNFDFQKKARLLANLDDISEDVAEVGIGGPNHGYYESISGIESGTRDRVVTARGDIEKLLRQAELQRSSYGEILDNLEETADRLRSTPSLRPVNVGFVTSGFGQRIDPFTGRKTRHRGIDYSARKGTPVFAPADGVVTYSGRNRSFGNVVEVSHGHGFVTRYAHLEKRLVKKGNKVRRGDVIGRVGSTGRSTFAHLHYEVEKDGRRVDPRAYVLAR